MASSKVKRTEIKTIKRLMKYITSEHKLQFIIVLLCILISAAVTVASSIFLEILIDDYITPLIAVENPVFDSLIKAILIMGVMYLAGVLATLIFSLLMVTISQKVLKKIRDDMFAHMQKFSIKYFDTNTHGDIMSRYTNDTDTLIQMLTQSLPQFISSFITIVAVFGTMIVSSMPLTLVVIVSLTVMFFMIRKIAANSAKYFMKQQESMGKVNGYIEEMIEGQKVIKVFCHEEEAKDKFDVFNEELCHNATQANKFANILAPIMTNIGHLQYVLIAIAGGMLLIGNIGGITLGVVASFLQLSKTLSMPISQISQQFNSVVMALAGSERIFDLMDEEIELDSGFVTLVNAKIENDKLVESENRTGIWAWKISNEKDNPEYVLLKGDVRFNNVDFGYEDNKTILHDINLYAEPGQKVAFVGSTGAGKTTITNLINRFYDIQEGEILYDGIDVKDIKKSDLRRSLGIVLQDTNLFTGTVMENIRYGKLDATDEEVHEAAKRANADGFISMLPNGYETVLSGDGSGLSQGQRQLLSIARAEVADAPVMILDESTSSIDTRTEAIVQKGMDKLMQGRTVFVIAHRLSTVQNSDVIMVLELGKIIERGSHEELISQKGRYYQLYTGAFELE